MRPLLLRTLAIFLPAAALLTLTCGLVYTEIQQDLRSAANDPQVQLAEDVVARLDAAAAPSSVVGASSVSLGASLAAFVAVYDRSGVSLASDGVLDGQPPAPPAGVLASARETGRDVVTWQPRSDLRFALVVLPWEGGTVLAGRSLRLVEERETNAEEIALLAWVVGLAALAVIAWVAARLWPTPPPLDEFARASALRRAA